MMKFVFCVLLILSIQCFAKTQPSVPAKPGIDNNKNYQFHKEPVKYLTAIYMDYHFSNVQRGLKRVNKGIALLDKQDSHAHFHPEKFKHSKVYEIKATLHLLKAMLLHKKAIVLSSSVSDEEKKQFNKLMQYKLNGEVRDHKSLGKLNTKDMLHFLATKKESSENHEGDYRIILKDSLDEMKVALSTDVNSPTIHYQYAKLLKEFYTSDNSRLIEQHLYRAGQLSHLESDSQGVEKALSALQEVNPNSIFIAKLKLLKK